MKLFLSLFFLPFVLFADVHFSDFAPYQGKVTRQELEERLGLFLQKNGKIGGYFSLNDEAFVMYDAPETVKDRQVEYRLSLSGEKRHGKKETRDNLDGIKIALDPGHLGGDYARLEERFIEIPASLEREEVARFDEGSLCFLTAAHLKKLLEKEGAEVMLTREGIGKGAYQDDFFDWLKKDSSLWSEEISLNGLFKRYNRLDLRARAEKINAFDPDLSVVIHYNSQEGTEGGAGNFCVTAQNYNMVFVPGAFSDDDLEKEENRYEFLRLLVTKDLHESAALSRAILDQMQSLLQVPVVNKADGARYLNRVALKVDEGIFARNLALTRLIHGPLCYGESLIQNNVDECINLSRKDCVIEGVKCSSRVKQVAEAYFEGIRNYLIGTPEAQQAQREPSPQKIADTSLSPIPTSEKLEG